MSFRNQTAVITGASSGLGKAISLALAEHGASVCLAARGREELEAVAREARTKAARVVTCQLDLTMDSDIGQLAATLRREFQIIDLLVHSAGAISIGPVATAPVEELDRQYRINVRTPYLLTQTLLPMIKLSRGQIVFVNSLVGIIAKANSSQYSMTKHALKALADSVRGEVNADGVRVLSVFLGRTATPMQARLQSLEGTDYSPEFLLQPEDVAGTVLNALSLPRTAELTDITIRHAIKPA